MGVPGTIIKPHEQASIAIIDPHIDPLTAKQYRTLALERNNTLGLHLSRYLTLAFVQDMIHGGGHGRQNMTGLVVRFMCVEPVGELFANAGCQVLHGDAPPPTP